MFFDRSLRSQTRETSPRYLLFSRKLKPVQREGDVLYVDGFADAGQW